MHGTNFRVDNNQNQSGGNLGNVFKSILENKDLIKQGVTAVSDVKSMVDKGKDAFDSYRKLKELQALSKISKQQNTQSENITPIINVSEFENYRNGKHNKGIDPNIESKINALTKGEGFQIYPYKNGKF